MISILQAALELLDSVVRLVGLASQPSRNPAAERYELLRIQRLAADAIARREIEGE